MNKKFLCKMMPIIIMLSSTAVLSEELNQSQKRMKMKNQIGVLADDSGKGLYYNRYLTSQLAFGGGFSESRKDYEFYAYMGNRYSYTNRHTFLNAIWHIMDLPVYVEVKTGLENTKQNEKDVTNFPYSEFRESNQYKEQKMTVQNALYSELGAGFQWIFDTGFALKFSLGRRFFYARNLHTDIKMLYYYGRYPNAADWIYETTMSSHFYYKGHLDSQENWFSFQAGYAF